MKVTYLGHSGFLLETSVAYYLFDYIRGTLPEFKKDKPLYVFSSHSHEDHFLKELLFDCRMKDARHFIFSNDIRRKLRREFVHYPKDLQDKIIYCAHNELITLDEVKIHPFRSTDIGFAYSVIEIPTGKVFYHAGDLNWWHWSEADKQWNSQMENQFKKAISLVKQYNYDIAFVPLDPRLEDYYNLGMDYFEEQVVAKTIFPMHFWEDYSIIQKYLDTHNFKNIISIDKENQIYEL